jgi:hypothetical protein
VFVADRENDRIQIFSPEGKYLTAWLDVQRPQDIFIDKDERVYVGELVWRAGMRSFRRGPIAEEEPSRLSIYDIDGNVLLRWGGADAAKPGHLHGRGHRHDRRPTRHRARRDAHVPEVRARLVWLPLPLGQVIFS